MIESEIESTCQAARGGIGYTLAKVGCPLPFMYTPSVLDSSVHADRACCGNRYY